MSVTSFVFASTNPGKCAEVARYAKPLGIEVVGAAEIADKVGAPAPVVAETGVTYEENAVMKARAFAQWSKLPCVADDTGIEFESLGGLPGVYTANWGILRVVSALGVDFQGAASFVCCMAYAQPSGRIVSVSTTLNGTIRFDPSVDHAASKPLQFSQFFYPAGYTESLVDLANRGTYVSHRHTTLRTLVSALS